MAFSNRRNGDVHKNCPTSMRVIAGSARGRPLASPPGRRIRPTTGRVKEAIFSMLEADAMRRPGDGSPFPYRRVLDLYSGTGALGIEALSRGAEHVDFVETDHRTRATILLNLERTGFHRQGKLHAIRAENAPSTLAGPYDLILADPPYADPSTLALLELIGRSALLAEGGVFILEHSSAFEPPTQAGSLRLDRTRRHGTSRVSLYRAADEIGT